LIGQTKLFSTLINFLDISAKAGSSVHSGYAISIKVKVQIIKI